MKKLKMISTTVIVLAIIGSSFAFNAKTIWTFCTSVNLSSTSCNTVTIGQKRGGSVRTAYYVTCWEGESCNGITCTVSANFTDD